VAAAARPAGEVRRRAQGLDVRELPPPVSALNVRDGQCFHSETTKRATLLLCSG
jgi:hypothetical protein